MHHLKFRDKKISKGLFSLLLVGVFALAFGPSLYAQFQLFSGSADVFGYGYGYDGYGYGYGYGYGPAKITVCHRTGSNNNPYQEISVSNNALKDGHANHAGDIIPAPAAGCPTAAPGPTIIAGGGGGGGGGGGAPVPQGQVLGTSTPNSIGYGYGYGGLPLPGTCFTNVFTVTMRIGTRGEQVRTLQIYLNNHGFPVASRGAGSPGNETSTFGGLTRAALIKFQEAAGIGGSERGVFGLQTMQLLNSMLNTANAPVCAAPPANFTLTLRVGSSGDEVKMLQVWLNAHGYNVSNTGAGSPGNETSYFGGLTRAALGRLQRAAGITGENGITGPQTREYLNTHP